MQLVLRSAPRSGSEAADWPRWTHPWASGSWALAGSPEPTASRSGPCRTSAPLGVRSGSRCSPGRDRGRAEAMAARPRRRPVRDRLARGRRGPVGRRRRQPHGASTAIARRPRRHWRSASPSCARSRSASTGSRPARWPRPPTAAGVPAVCGFNYRYIPAMRLARDIVAERRARTDRPVPGRLHPGLRRRRGAAPAATTGRGR